MGWTGAKRALPTSVAVFGVLSAPAFAADAVKSAALTKPPVLAAFDPSLAGYVEFFGQRLWAHDYYDPWAGFGGAGRLNYWTAPDRSMQFDISAQSATDTPTHSVSITSYYGAFHLSHRNAAGLWGGFGGVAMTGHANYTSLLDTSVFAGLEAQRYSGPLTLYGQAGFVHPTTTSSSGPVGDLWFGQVEARYFVTSDLKLSANLGVFAGDAFGSGTKETWLTYGAEAEYKFASNPLGVFARYDGFSGSGLYTKTGYSIEGGIKLTFGVKSLEDQDRKGATLKVANDLVPVADIRVLY